MMVHHHFKAIWYTGLQSFKTLSFSSAVTKTSNTVMKLAPVTFAVEDKSRGTALEMIKYLHL